MCLDGCIRKLAEDKREDEIRNKRSYYNSIHMKFEGYRRGCCDGRILDMIKIPTNEYIEMDRIGILSRYRVEEITDSVTTLKLIDRRHR